jgi:hypothetical protein
VAIQSFNSLGGFSVGEAYNLIIDNTGNVQTDALTANIVTSNSIISNVGPIIFTVDGSNIMEVGQDYVSMNGNTIVSDYVGIGDIVPDETNNIIVNGVNYNTRLIVSDFNDNHIAQTMLHRHSTTIEPILAGVRSNTDDESDADVTPGQNLLSIYGAGTAGDDYKTFAQIILGVDNDDSNIGQDSAPGRIEFLVTPDGSVNPSSAMLINQQGIITTFNDVNVNGSLIATSNVQAANLVVATGGNLWIGDTPFVRTLTVGSRTGPVTVPMASNNSFNVPLAHGGNAVVITT